MKMHAWAGGLISSLLLTGCMHSSTITNDHERRQFMLIPQKFYIDRSNQAFAKSAKQRTKTGVVYVQDQRLNKILNRLTPIANQMVLDQRKIDWQIKVVMNHTPNAYALPGGQIIIHSAFAWDPQFTDAELASLIAHEMIHVIREHSREKASHAAASQAGLLAALTGVGAAAYATGYVVNTLAQTLPHSRLLEHEADFLGAELMQQAGFNAKAAVNFWAKTEHRLGKTKTESTLPSFLSTHTAVSERLPILAEYIAHMPSRDEQLIAENVVIRPNPALSTLPTDQVNQVLNVN